MPALAAGFAGIKWVNVHPSNPGKGLPTVMATIILSDPATGEPLACMDGTVITNYRTGAAAAVASKYLARASAKTLGLVGLGEQAKTQLLCIAELFPLKEVKVFDINEGTVERFLRQFAGFNLPRCQAVWEAVAADIVSTTTPVTSPIVKREWVKEGTHLNAMGADAKGKEELDPDLLQAENVRIIVDNRKQAIHSGEVNVPLSQNLLDETKISGTLSEVVAGWGSVCRLL
jgi:alanine dehydrogenase